MEHLEGDLDNLLCNCLHQQHVCTTYASDDDDLDFYPMVNFLEAI